MNKTRRAAIKKAITNTQNAYDLIDSAYEEERECLENFPENLQSSDRYEALENYTELLEEARDQLGYACDALNQIFD